MYQKKEHKQILIESGFNEIEIEERIEKINNLPLKSKLKEKIFLLYPSLIANEKWNEYCKGKFKLSLEGLTKVYGEIEGTEKWEKYCEKRLVSYKIKRSDGFSFNNGRSLDEYTKRHGEKEGYLLWEKRNKKHKERFSIEFYINKFGEEKGIKEYLLYLKSMDKTSLKACIKKYGVEEGKIKYMKFIENNKFHLTVTSKESYIKRYGEIEGLLKYKKWLKSVADGLKSSTKKIKNSKVQKFFWMIYDLIENKYKEKIKFKELNNEEVVYCFLEDKQFYLIDFKCGNAIIEFQGSFFHKHSKEKDLQKKLFLESKRYKVLEVFEKEFDENKFIQLENCINFIKENY